MAYADFNGWLNRKFSPGEVNSGERIVEPGESLPTRVLVERIMNAGVAHQVHNAMQRLYMFGAGEEIPEGFIGPLGRYSTDIIDVANLKLYLAELIRGNKEKAAEIAAAAKERKDAASQTGSGVPENPPAGGDDAGGAQ